MASNPHSLEYRAGGVVARRTLAGCIAAVISHKADGKRIAGHDEGIQQAEQARTIAAEMSLPARSTIPAGPVAHRGTFLFASPNRPAVFPRRDTIS